LGGSLDVIAALRTVAIKVSSVYCSEWPCHSYFLSWQVQASGQRLKYFQKLQIQCKVPEPLRIPLHSNIRWGSAFWMLERGLLLRQVRGFQSSIQS
jgi:hypothetical protein